MEAWEGAYPYSEFMNLPHTRRMRLIHKKIDLERERKVKMEAARKKK